LKTDWGEREKGRRKEKHGRSDPHFTLG